MEKKQELDKKLKEQALKDADEGKIPHFVNKCKCIQFYIIIKNH